jgi:hypothetical protein
VSTEDPEFSWHQPAAFCPDHPLLQEFLQGPEQSFLYTGIEHIGDAMDLVSKCQNASDHASDHPSPNFHGFAADFELRASKSGIVISVEKRRMVSNHELEVISDSFLSTDLSTEEITALEPTADHIETEVLANDDRHISITNDSLHIVSDIDDVPIAVNNQRKHSIPLGKEQLTAKRKRLARSPLPAANSRILSTGETPRGKSASKKKTAQRNMILRPRSTRT